MFKTLLIADMKKIKRTWILFLIALGPIGVVILQGVNFGLRYEYLTQRYAEDVWGGLLFEIRNFVPVVIIIGMAIITSLVANMEHQNDSWKQMLALPVKKIHLYGSKWILGFGLLLLSCLTLAVGSTILGLILGFGTDIPINKIMVTSFYPYFASLPFFAFFIWLAIIKKNQAPVIIFGILGTVFVPYGMGLPFWNPISWPSLYNQWEEPLWNALAGIGLALILYLLGSLDFRRRDVNS